VKAALDSVWPVQRADYPPWVSKLDPFKVVIDEILIADLDAPRKQRHTVTRIFDRPYDMHTGGTLNHPLLGRLAPDLPLITATGRTRVAEVMRRALPVLLDLTNDSTLIDAARDWKDRIDIIAGRSSRPGTPRAMLLRPDGYIAWVATNDYPRQPFVHGPRDALTTWFGALD
jgi:hypothetical protein